MRFPDFLIIGAMKSGITTLYRDLQTNPSIFMPEDKESHSLCDDAVLTPAGREAYARLFRPAREDQLCGEASTGYTKLPDYPGVVGRAAATLPGHAKFIYVVRDPIARLVSHHHHALTEGRCSSSIEEALRELPELIEYSRYWTQVRPWVDRFGAERVRVVVFESMVKDRVGACVSLCEWLGVRARPELVDPGTVHNASERKPVLTGGWRALQQSWVYQRALRPVLSHTVRRTLRESLLPKAPERPGGPSEGVLERLRAEFAPEVRELRRIVGGSGEEWLSKYDGG